MIKLVLAVGAALLACGAAWAADDIVDGGGFYAVPSAHAPFNPATMELKWDNGLRRWSRCWLEGYQNSWVANDFDAATLKTTYAKILKYKYYTRGAWPNEGWEGMRFAFYGFRGGVPGSMLWPTSGNPYFFKPSNSNIQAHIWVEFDVNWTCPSVKFVAAQEQFYTYPYCDPFSVDNNTTFTGHSWLYREGNWTPFQPTSEPLYRNLMIRVWVEPGQEFPGVAPSSIGRVKALYY